MFLTPYTVLPSGLDSLDPLGFLRPYTALSDALLPQFTTLTASPACHGFLCWAVGFLRQRRASDRDFARGMRDLEILWGALCIKGSRPEGVLNIVRLSRLPRTGLTLGVARREKYGLYLRPGYGVRGHYAGPSAVWGFLSADQRLTDAGKALADAWDFRLTAGKRRSSRLPTFTSLAERWMDNLPVLDDPALGEDVCRRWSVSAGEPNSDERQVWKRAVSRAIDAWPAGEGLWTSPPSDELKKMYSSDRFRFFPELLRHYAAQNASGRWDELLRRLDRCRAFEQFAALTQFAFEWEYLRRERAGGSAPVSPHPDLFAELRQAAEDAAKAVCAAGLDWNMPERLRACTSYAEQMRAVIAMHVEHQKRKLAQPFLDEHDVLLADRLPYSPAPRLADDLADADNVALRRGVMNAYPRTWFFNNVWRWLDYLGESRGHIH